MRLLLDEGGNLFVNGYIGQNENPIQAPSKKKLCLTHNGDIKLALTEDSLQIKDELRPGYISGPTQNDFVLYNPSSGSQVWPQAIVGTGDPQIDGDLSISGVENDNTTPVSSVYYVDGEGVYTRDATSFEFAYANLNGEGRTEYSGGVEQTNIYYITDHLGSTRMTINENADQVEAYSYTAYGIIKEFTAYSGDATREKFTGKEFDTDGDENGAIGIQLAYFGARFYDPETGIWITTDPAGQYYNPYSYVDGNPIAFIDPTGEYGWVAGLIVGAAIGGTVGGIAAGAVEGGLEWWQGMLIGAAVGGALGVMGSEEFQNYALYREWMRDPTSATPGAKMDVVKNAETIVAEDQAIIKKTGQGNWHKKGSIPKKYQTNTVASGGDWEGVNKCNRFLQVSDKNIPETNIAGLNKNMTHLDASKIAPGNKVLFPRDPSNVVPGASGHGLVVGREGSWLHASSVLKGAAETKGWGRIFYKWFAQGYFGKIPVVIP